MPMTMRSSRRVNPLFDFIKYSVAILFLERIPTDFENRARAGRIAPMSTDVIILAAGHGKRMESQLPKPLVLLRDRPLIAYVLDSVKRTGICEKPIVVIGRQKELVVEAL